MDKRICRITLGFFGLLFSLSAKSDISYPSDFIAPGHWVPLESPTLIGSHEILVISNNLDETARTGEKILLYRLSPDALINGVGAHDSFEEVIITQGQLAWLNQDEARSVQTILEVGSYVNRAPHIPHGPFRAGPDGCQMFVRYYY